MCDAPRHYFDQVFEASGVKTDSSEKCVLQSTRYSSRGDTQYRKAVIPSLYRAYVKLISNIYSR
jgi:hypothetical protein